jgi:hypothetical protein
METVILPMMIAFVMLPGAAFVYFLINASMEAELNELDKLNGWDQ